jgi:hypothetical protein
LVDEDTAAPACEPETRLTALLTGIPEELASTVPTPPELRGVTMAAASVDDGDVDSSEVVALELGREGTIEVVNKATTVFRSVTAVSKLIKGASGFRASSASNCIIWSWRIAS